MTTLQHLYVLLCTVMITMHYAPISCMDSTRIDNRIGSFVAIPGAETFGVEEKHTTYSDDLENLYVKECGTNETCGNIQYDGSTIITIKVHDGWETYRKQITTYLLTQAQHEIGSTPATSLSYDPRIMRTQPLLSTTLHEFGFNLGNVKPLITIRPCTPQDIPKTILDQYQKENQISQAFVQKCLNKTKKELKEDGKSYCSYDGLVAMHTTRGCVAFLFYSIHDDKTGNYLGSSAQGGIVNSTICSQFIEALESIAYQEKCTTIFVRTSGLDAESIAVLKKVGYVKSEEHYTKSLTN